jgi:hypothetical protein
LSGRQHGQVRQRERLEWVTSAEIADRAMKDKGLSDKRIRAMFIATFLVRLGQMQRSGKLEKSPRRARTDDALEASRRVACPLSVIC